MKKGKDGTFHPDIEAAAKTILTNRIVRSEFEAFIDKAYNGVIQGSRATAAGFIESNVAAYLKKNAGIDIGDSVTISLEARLLNGPKAVRHGLKGDALGIAGAYTTMDALLYGQVYYDSGNLIYLFPHSANQLTKITVNPISIIEGRGSKINSPCIVNIETLNVSKKDTGYVRIIEGLKRIK